MGDVARRRGQGVSHDELQQSRSPTQGAREAAAAGRANRGREAGEAGCHDPARPGGTGKSLRRERLRDAGRVHGVPNGPSSSNASARSPNAKERQRSYVAPFVELEQGLPDALDVAFALSQRHAGVRPVSQAALLVESGLADDESEAARLCKSRKGKDLVASLR